MTLKYWEVELQHDARFRCVPSLQEENFSQAEESMSALIEKIVVAVMLLEILVSFNINAIAVGFSVERC